MEYLPSYISLGKIKQNSKNWRILKLYKIYFLKFYSQNKIKKQSYKGVKMLKQSEHTHTHTHATKDTLSNNKKVLWTTITTRKPFKYVKD